MMGIQTSYVLNLLQIYEIFLFSASFWAFSLGFENKIIFLRMKSYDGIEEIPF